jgi:hypothetical protein
VIDQPHYTPQNWYWRVGGDQNRVWSSAAGGYVPLTDLAFQAWLDLHERGPTRIGTEQQLWDVLADAGVALPGNTTASDEAKDRRIGTVDRVMFEMMFNHENRIRTLENRTTITKAQFIGYIKGLI